MPRINKTDKKRTIIIIPYKEYSKIQKYGSKYNLSFSSSIITLALRGLEYEEFIENLPDMITTINRMIDEGLVPHDE